MAPSSRRRTAPIRATIAALAVATATLSTIGAGTAEAKASTTPQLGFNTYVADACQSATVWSNYAKHQFPLLRSLDANSIALAFPLYTYSMTSDAIFAKRTCGAGGYETPSTARLEVLIKEAHALHLRVLLRPILDETVLQKVGGWRGAIKPANVRLWFKAYLATLTPYLKLAQQQHVEYFAIATELDSLATKSNWSSLIASAKKLYKGQLSFTINWSQTASGKVSRAGTTPGMDAYQAAALPNSATPAQLLTAWNNALAHTDTVPFSMSSATIDEVAILAQQGAYSEPWEWSLPLGTHPFDQSIQANWYSMVCSFFQSHHMQGVYFWGINYNSGGNAVLYSPEPSYPQSIQPASVAVIKSCYAHA